MACVVEYCSTIEVIPPIVVTQAVAKAALSVQPSLMCYFGLPGTLDISASCLSAQASDKFLTQDIPFSSDARKGSLSSRSNQHIKKKKTLYKRRAACPQGAQSLGIPCSFYGRDEDPVEGLIYLGFI